MKLTICILGVLIAGCAGRTPVEVPTTDWRSVAPDASGVSEQSPLSEREAVAEAWLRLPPRPLQRGITRVDQETYDYVKMRLRDANKPIEIIQLHGREAIVLYGCVLTTP